jgi:hypothetical protein
LALGGQAKKTLTRQGRQQAKGVLDMSTRTLMMVVLGVCIAAVPAFAAPINITMYDGYSNSEAGVHGKQEDNETEPGTYYGQKWDLEGIFYDANTRSVTVVGGWDFINGYSNLTSGDLFISLEAPVIDEQLNGTSIFNSNQMGYWGYDYAIRVGWANAANNVAHWQVYSGAAAVDINQVTDIKPQSNPWRVTGSGGADQIFGSTTQVDGSGYGFAGWIADNKYGSALNNVHYAVTFDLNWLITDDWLDQDAADLFFHFTYECGNDMVRAKLETKDMTTTVVPEPATMTLLGLGIAGMITLQMRKKATRA